MNFLQAHKYIIIICVFQFPFSAGDEQFESIEDQSLVTIKSKFFNGSSGTVWASDYIMLRSLRPYLFEVPRSTRYKYFSLGFRQIMAALQDSLNYFCLTNVNEDIAWVLILEETKNYHSSRLRAVIKAICYVKELMTQHVEKFSSEERRSSIYSFSKNGFDKKEILKMPRRK